MRTIPGCAATAALLAILAGTAPASGQLTIKDDGDPGTVRLLNGDHLDLDSWEYGNLYGDSWRAGQLIDVEVRGEEGEEIGAVDDIVVDPSGRIQSLIISTESWLGLEGRQFAVPWDQLRVAGSMEYVTLPLSEGEVDEYVPEDDDALGRTGQVRTVRDWEVAALLGDRIRLRDGAGSATVEDVLFNQDGQVTALVVEANQDVAAPGRYAVPFEGGGEGPGLGTFDQPETAELEPFDYGRMSPQALAEVAAD